MRTVLKCAAFAAAVAMAPAATAAAQEHPARRLSNIVSVAVDEYGKGVDARGRIVLELEYREAVDFLQDARGVAQRLSGADADLARTLLDSIIATVAARRPPAELAALHARFNAALGAEAALEMPERPIDLAEGEALFQQHCASCHGARGRGDGPAASGMNPPPLPIGTATHMWDVSPALAYRVTSVGIKGTPMTGWEGVLTAEQRWNIIAYLATLRSDGAQVLEGEGLYMQRCASCHGRAGEGDGEYARALTRLPPEVGSFAWQAERSDAQIAAAIRAGIPGSAMPGSPDLNDAQLASLVAFVRTLAARPEAVAMSTASGDAAQASRAVIAQLDESLEHARAGRSAEAGDRAFDAYITFEPLETSARARNPGLVASMERHFADFKGAVRAKDLRAATRSRNAIEASMPSILELSRPPEGGWGAFLQSFLIILREGFEAILVIGAIVAFLIKTGHREKLRSIWVGCVAALAASAVTAVVLQTVLRALPATREIIEGVTMLVAVAVLFSVSYWLISKVEAARWQQFIREKVTAALEHGGGRALAVVAFLAVYREGAETALFYQAMFNEGARNLAPILLGIVVGGALLAIIFTAFYRYGVKIPLRPFFAVTSVLLYYMAFVFAGKGIRELQEGNVVPITVIPGFPHVDAMGIFPSVETLLAQLVLLLLFAFALLKTFWPSRSVALPSAPPEAVAAPPVAAQVAELKEHTMRLQARLAALEDAVAEDGSRPKSEV
jgi:high-affinity iron transporter